MCEHNFTIFNIESEGGYCFIWNETEGGVGYDEYLILSILSAFIARKCQDIGKNEELYLFVLLFYSM